MDLVSGVEVALNHHSDDVLVAVTDLRGDAATHDGLVLVQLGGVAVRHVDDELGALALLPQEAS